MEIKIYSKDDCEVTEANATSVTLNGDNNKTLLSIIQELNIYLDAPCNGNGKCGKCVVLAKGKLSEVTDKEREVLSAKKLAAGYRLACKTYPIGDCTVTLSAQDNMGVKAEGRINTRFKLSPSVLTDNTAAYGMAVDIGTTTVACYIYDLKSGERVAVYSGLNEQRRYGADVISRMNSCIEDKDGLKQLQRTIVEEINSFIDEFCRSGHNKEEILDAVIAANTVMLHLFAGLSPNGIATAPFTPTSLFGHTVSVNDIGLNIPPSAKVYLANCISGYVGGDITAGILSADVYNSSGNVIYIDIGTNGEMAVGNKDGFVCCATAAGPAFEGAHIKHGVGGVSGAISKVYIEDNDIKFETIDNAPPIGICGSGLIDAIAVMLKLSVIDETGRLDEDEIPDHLLYRYSDDNTEEFFIDKASGISITQKDIREIQLAKAAIAAGIKTMLHAKSIGFSDVERLVLAGGFGSFIDKHSACTIGLLPIELEDRIDVVGNAAGMGAITLLLSDQSREVIKDITKNTEYYELSGDGFFQDQYIEEMVF